MYESIISKVSVNYVLFHMVYNVLYIFKFLIETFGALLLNILYLFLNIYYIFNIKEIFFLESIIRFH